MGERAYPKSIWIELTNKCNLRCEFCFHSNDSMTRKKGSMDFETFKKIIKDIEGFKPRLSLHHSGESFLHKDLLRFIGYAKEHGLYVGLTTNGTLIDKDNFSVLDSGLDQLNISLAGVDEEDYEMVRPGFDFSRISEKITLLAAEKVKRGSAMRITINVIKTKHNRSRVSRFKKRFGSIEGIDGVIVRKLMAWSDKVDVDRLEMDDIWFLSRKKSIAIYKYLMLKVFGRELCESVNRDSAILWDGTVVPCCVDFNANLKVGNIKESSFDDIWFGEEMERIRKMLRSHEAAKKHPICGPCLAKQ